VFGAADNGSGEEQEAISLAAGQGRADSPAARFRAFWQGQLEGPLVALWRHFPGDDLASPEALAAAHARWYRRFPFDFLKVTPAAGSLAQAWGLTVEPTEVDELGVYARRFPVVHEAADWRGIEPVDPTQGFLGDQLRVLQLLRRDLGPDVPLVATLFSPLSAAAALSGSGVYRHLAEDPEAVHQGLRAITETIAAFARQVYEAGADAVFYSTLSATAQHISREDFQTFGRPYDLQVLEAAGAGPLILHIHGEDCYLDDLLDYPVQAFNWHDRRVGPPLAEVRERTDRVLVGGINDHGVIASGTPAEVAAEIADARRQVPDGRLIVAPGCVIPVDCPPANLDAALAAVRT